jgi:ribosomal protein S18 acetylase RimI-like enzyme
MNLEKKEMIIERRPAEDSDMEFARAIHHASYKDVVVEQFGGWDEEAQDRFFEAVWKKTPHEIVSCDGELCGYFSFQETDDAVELHELVLHPAFQGRGIGTRLLNDALEKAKTRNVPAKLQVLKHNAAADLYRRLGFVVVGETDTHLQMEFRPTEKA